MSVTKNEFGKVNGKDIFKFSIENKNGMKACVINYGAILTELWVPDKDGKLADVVLGYDALEPYFENGSFFGATVGPVANRTANAAFTLDGKTYNLAVNDGVNNLHSDHAKGYHKVVYDCETGEDFVSFSMKDDDMNMGFPGNKCVKVTYSLSEDNELKIHYEASSDKDTVINMTNHSYFNLKGHDQGKIEDHILTINASKFTPVVAGAIPTGELKSVDGTVFDFTKATEVGARIADDEEQLKLVQGYDHNWVLDDYEKGFRKIATVSVPSASRVMEVYTDLPAVQFYAGNCIGATVGKNETSYGPRCGLCLETQYSPDSANHPEWPSCVYGPNRKYDTYTSYKFV